MNHPMLGHDGLPFKDCGHHGNVQMGAAVGAGMACMLPGIVNNVDVLGRQLLNELAFDVFNQIHEGLL
jgi:hypothetical protein